MVVKSQSADVLSYGRTRSRAWFMTRDDLAARLALAPVVPAEVAAPYFVYT